jgi:putative two-component system response regulator
VKVLVIDDEPIARKAIEHALRHGGYEVYSAADGWQGLALLRETGCQLVVTDWMMPGMNGVEFCQAVRESDLPHYVYMIMVTSRDCAEDAIRGLEGGADDYITKPFNPTELLLRVKTGRRIISLESREVTIFALARLAESRDQETGAHLERVRAYCRVIAMQLKNNGDFPDVIDDEFVRLVFDTSPLHDIGKVAIPDSILLKPDRLSREEFDIMKTHTTKGAETLAAALEQFPHARFLEMAHEIAISHHEKYNGKGYPYGLAGEEIPLSGRIVALADVYDALTSKRGYKDAYSHKMTRSVIVGDAGEHFDPVVVDAFRATEEEFVRIRQRYQDQPVEVEPAYDAQGDLEDLLKMHPALV